ncbi:MAG: chromosome segregation protein SMC [Firmicutes bacterium HGW-Firmicutes-21]|nr:MAG: chromosome segregation protein SMC [Firmicutes bacterium HGW-Firmicutes-21]
MRLKSIEMQGFKSFPDKTKISFDSGVTAIIGPNGSGKSNISDAVRWVLGEMSLKSLRGSRMEDVIFNGAAGRPPSNFSSVSIVLDTEEEFNQAQNTVFDFGELTEGDKKDLSAIKMRLSDHKEVVVTRKYYRSGESEYYINKSQVRLKDIYELFYDTGIGREGYSVIGQGKIAEVLSQKGDERRSIFEEAAGISKYRYKKSEAERKLRDTEINLIRINDILGEVSSRIGPLAKEAENAKEYLVLSEEKKALEITLWLDRIDEVKTELSKNEVAYNTAKYSLEQSEERVKTLEASLDGIINENYELSRILSETERKKSEAGQRSGGIESKKAVLINDIAHYKRITEDNEQAIATLSNDISSTLQMLEQADKEAAAVKREVDNIDEKVKALQADFEIKHTETALLHKQLEEANSNYSEIYEKNNSVISTGARIDAELELAKRSNDSSSDNITSSELRINELNDELERVKLSEQTAKNEYENLLKQKIDTENKIDILRKDNEKIRDDIVSQRLTLAADEQKREHLTRLEQLLEGYSESVRSVISDAKQDKITVNGKPIGIHGTVSSLISTEGEYVVALETALAAAVQFIVVDGEEDAKAAIDYLKTNKTGRATFLPLSTVKGKKCDITDLENIEGFIGIASSLTKSDIKYEGIIDDLLGRTIIATDIDAAIRIAKKSRYKIKIVTCDGQVINAGGSFTGGASAKKVGLLTRAMDIERLSVEIRLKNAALLEKERESAAIQKQITAFSELIMSENPLITEKKNLLNSLSNEINTLSVRLEEERKRKDLLLSGKTEFESRIALLLKQKEDYSLTVKADGELLEAAKSLLAEIKERVEYARTAEENAYGELNEARLALYEKRSSADRQEEQVKQLSERIGSLTSRISELKNSTERAKADILNRENEIILLDKEKESVTAEIQSYDESLQKLLSGREAQEKETNNVRLAVKEAQTEKEDAFRNYTSLEARQAKLNGDYGDISSKLWDEYELTYSSAIPYRLPSEKMQKAQYRLGTLKSRIRAMGSINVNAVEEYRQEKERYDFLTIQTDDLNKTRKSLDNAILKLNNEMKQTFTDCFYKINAAFGEVFTVLFGGGSAYIELTDPEMPLECGIDIIIKPPGKSVRSISLLSGGEQSFAAIALYLALQKINPAPFCIFDEIESALDDINLVKFADYVRENSYNTQYILITHRRGTMERADTLYGVTMRQKGISDYIKLNVSKFEESIKEYTD